MPAGAVRLVFGSIVAVALGRFAAGNPGWLDALTLDWSDSMNCAVMFLLGRLGLPMALNALKLP